MGSLREEEDRLSPYLPVSMRKMGAAPTGAVKVVHRRMSPPETWESIYLRNRKPVKEFDGRDDESKAYFPGVNSRGL